MTYDGAWKYKQIHNDIDDSRGISRTVYFIVYQRLCKYINTIYRVEHIGHKSKRFLKVYRHFDDIFKSYKNEFSVRKSR